MALVAAAHSPALAALLPALEEEHGPLTAAVEAQYLSLLDELPSLTIEGIRRRPVQARATASGLQSQLTRRPRGLCTVRTGYAYRPPARCTHQRRRAAGAPPYVRCTRTSLGRAVRTAYRVVHRRRSIGSSYSTRCS